MAAVKGRGGGVEAVKGTIFSFDVSPRTLHVPDVQAVPKSPRWLFPLLPLCTLVVNCVCVEFSVD